LLGVNLSKWRGWESSIAPQVRGHHLFTWWRRRPQELGAFVAITNALTRPRLTIATPCHTSKTSLHIWSGKQIFSKIDLVRGYNQIPVAAADIPKTAVITPFEFLRMPFGLKNAAQAFQRLMDQVCRGLEDFLFVYLDDILVASSNAKEYRRHLRLLFKRLAEHGLVVNVAKCVFGVDTIDFLGHRVTVRGVKPLPEAIHRFPQPQEAKALTEFLGMVNFYHRFMPHAASLMGPLHSMSNDKLQSAFAATKQALASATLLVHPSATATTCLTVDASDLAIGGVLEQYLDDCWKPLAFFSRKLDKAQKSFDRELLAISQAFLLLSGGTALSHLH
jgi:hypothetical protein